MIFRCGLFEFDAGAGELRKGGRLVALEPQPARALALLLSRAGEVVSREELRDAVWGPGTHVEFDRGLAYCLSQIRTALGDSGDNPRFVQTIPRRGYKFIAPVSAPASSAGAASGPPQTERQDLLAPVTTSLIDRFTQWQVVAFISVFVILAGAWIVGRVMSPQAVVVAVSVFDNETGEPAYDRIVAGLSDLVVTRLANLDRSRIAVIGNAAVLRQPRNIRDLKAVAAGVKADYVLLGQLQRGDGGLRFITHFIRLADQAHLKANRLQMPDGSIAGLETHVVEEFERAVREHVLKSPAN